MPKVVLSSHNKEVVSQAEQYTVTIQPAGGGCPW